MSIADLAAQLPEELRRATDGKITADQLKTFIGESDCLHINIEGTLRLMEPLDDYTIPLALACIVMDFTEEQLSPLFIIGSSDESPVAIGTIDDLICLTRLLSEQAETQYLRGMFGWDDNFNPTGWANLFGKPVKIYAPDVYSDNPIGDPNSSRRSCGLRKHIRSARPVQTQQASC